MPHIVVHLSGSPDPALARRVAARVTDLTASILRKDPAVTAIAVQFFEPELWFIGRVPLSESGARTYFLAISITDETNLKAEKARYLAEMHAALSEELGGVAEHSYIHVEDVRAAAYGYGGRTQEWRYQQPAA